MSKPPFNALEVQRRLWTDLAQKSQLVMPNYTPTQWWECDVMAVSKAGYWSEFEIKLSVSDFRADAAKAECDGWALQGAGLPMKKVTGRNKHQELAAHSITGPSYFWFVIPEDMLPKVEIPEWAGVQLVQPREDEQPLDHRPVSIWTHKPAPRLHKQKISEIVLTHARGVCYWRYWNLKTDLMESVRRELARQAA